MSEDEWVDLETAARRLGVAPKLVRRLVDDGELDVRRAPIRIRRSELDACLERCRIAPGALAHLDPNAGKRADPHRRAPLTRAGRPDRRYGRRYGPR